MSAASAAIPHFKQARSCVSNHSDLLPGIDGRSVVARRYRDLFSALCSDAGGMDRMSEARVQLARRYAALAVQAETMEAGLARGEAMDLTSYTQLVSTLVRVASRLGINRVPRDVTPDIKTYLSRRASNAEVAA